MGSMTKVSNIPLHKINEQAFSNGQHFKKNVLRLSDSINNRRV